MADLPESTEWATGIYQLETSDPVLGGPEGISNLQAKQLVSRTRWLKLKFDSLIDGTVSVAKAVKLATARTISISGAATGNTSFDGSANSNITLTLTDSGVTAATYPVVTVNGKGLVTAGRALIATDIPALSWGQITSGKPTTLSGYGITDAYTVTQTNTALALKAPLASPALMGTPTAPTAAPGTNTQQLANTAFVQATISAVVAGAPGALDTLKELSDALGGDPNFANTIVNALAKKPDKATTLGGYGIVDAFTQTQSDARYFMKADYPGGIPRNTASLGESGWWRCGDTGLVRQRVKILVGDVALGAKVTVVWPTQFPNQCSSIVATLEAASISSGSKFSVQYAIISKSLSGCVIALAEWVSEIQAADLTLNIQAEGH